MVIERIIYSWIIQLKDWKNLNALTQSYNVFRGFLNRWYGVKPIKNTYEDCLSWFKENSY